MYRIIRITAATLVLSAALIGCSAQEVTEGDAAGEGTKSATPSNVPVKTTPAPPTEAQKQAYVMEVIGQWPEAALIRDELVQDGLEICEAFRSKPGSVADTLRKAKDSGESADSIKLMSAMMRAAIHNLCIDQAGDL